MKRTVNGSEIYLDEKTGQVFLHSACPPGVYASSMKLRNYEDNTVKMVGNVICSLEALQTALEMLSDPVKPDCDECPHRILRGVHPTTPARPICELAHCFIDELDGICLKTLPIEEVRRLCGNYRPPEKRDDNKSCCITHLLGARAFCCSICKIEDLLRCEDYDLEVPEEQALVS